MSPPAGGTAGKPLADAASQTIRANLVTQYNNIITQITTTAQDSSFNGINLLNGDDLKLTFNETGKSTLNIQGVTSTRPASALRPLTAAPTSSTTPRPTRRSPSSASASDMLRSEASALGSNLSIVQIRQDFSKNLINVLQTGSSNLTLADTNEEAANSQALSTRQSIAVSALALANQSPAERAPAAPLSSATQTTIRTAGETPPFSFRSAVTRNMPILPEYGHIW